nr:putative integron gene cassette protein [uncultured bacterium]
MSAIEFSKDEKEILAQKIQSYFREELDQEIGQFDALFLLDFVSEEIGSYFYNRGLYDAQAILEKRIEDVNDSILELEKITDFRR